MKTNNWKKNLAEAMIHHAIEAYHNSIEPKEDDPYYAALLEAQKKIKNTEY